jgi:hypothetical protein
VDPLSGDLDLAGRGLPVLEFFPLRDREGEFAVSKYSQTEPLRDEECLIEAFSRERQLSLTLSPCSEVKRTPRTAFSILHQAS